VPDHIQDWSLCESDEYLERPFLKMNSGWTLNLFIVGPFYLLYKFYGVRMMFLFHKNFRHCLIMIKQPSATHPKPMIFFLIRSNQGEEHNASMSKKTLSNIIWFNARQDMY